LTIACNHYVCAHCVQPGLCNILRCSLTVKESKCSPSLKLYAQPDH